MSKGKFIVFEGLDGSGKTTQIQLLQQELAQLDISIFQTKQPTDFVRQSAIFRTFMDMPNHDAYDYRSLSLLAASDRVQHCNRVIMPQLAEGNIVISDRYYYCCLANLRARGYSNDKWIYEIAESVPKPDFAFFLDIDVDTAIKRVRSRPSERERYIDIDLQHKLRAEFLEIAKMNGGIVLPSTETPKVLAEKVKHVVLQRLSVKGDGTLCYATT